MVVVAEIGQSVQFGLAGTATEIKCAISAVAFDFGAVMINPTVWQTRLVENASPYLPLTFSFKAVPTVSFQPPSGTILARTARQIDIGFNPKSVGPFRLKSAIQICQGLVRSEITLQGIGVGPEGRGMLDTAAKEPPPVKFHPIEPPAGSKRVVESPPKQRVVESPATAKTRVFDHSAKLRREDT
jgi:hypothetical protein